MNARPQSATWNREDRDLIIELKTNMQNVRDEVGLARAEIKEINTGITARLLNLEGNAVSKIELKEIEDRIRTLEDAANQWIGKQAIIGAMMGGAFAIFCAVISALQIHF